MPDYGLGRLPASDPRDEAYPMRALIERKPAPKVSSRTWKVGPVLDQGATPTCVGHGWKGWLLADPLMDPPDDPPTAFELYDLAQQNDEWPGPPPPYAGSSVRGGVKGMSQLGKVGMYHWSQDTADVRDYLLSSGPVVLGVNWSHSMFHPDVQGVVHYDPSDVAGGHCFLCYGYNKRRRAFLNLNSWGAGWGLAGSFWIPEPDLAKLLADQGEACAAQEIKPFK